MADAKKVPPTRRTGGGRVTPKGGAAGAKARAQAKAEAARTKDSKASKSAKSPKSAKSHSGSEPAESSRYTPRTVRSDQMPSPVWVPVLMFVLFGLGMLVIFLNYVNLVPGGESNNWYLLAGLGLILGGIITATQYR